MITKINLKNVACYKNQTTLETDKKINLIYGLNGTGKSTLSNFLYKKDEEQFSYCSIEGLDDDTQILVYNQSFIEDNFYESNSLKGIFTLSEQNKQVEIEITQVDNKINELNKEKQAFEKKIAEENKLKDDKLADAQDKIWEIKTSYSGEGRVFDYCLKGKKARDRLFVHLTTIEKTSEKPSKTISDLKNELQSLSGVNATTYDLFSEISFIEQSKNIENHFIFSKQIIGNENSTVSQLIKELGNSDWVKAGYEKYLSPESSGNVETCPFCQEKTISDIFRKNIQNYFNESYEKDIQQLKKLSEDYSKLTIPKLPDLKNIINTYSEALDFIKEYELNYDKLTDIFKENKRLIEQKISTPSALITLNNSSIVINKLNEIINFINNFILDYNEKLKDVEKVKKEIENQFWQIMRWNYDDDINSYLKLKSKSNNEIHNLENLMKSINSEINNEIQNKTQLQKNTSNIEGPIKNINKNLIDLGITNFSIKKHSENFYTIVRENNNQNVFISLSEGEKMIISFLYFIELCKGKKNISQEDKKIKKIIVIDDPISSLSHIFIFNVGRLIKNEFLGVRDNNTWKYNYEQVFILTHSLYFYYEITERDHKIRKKNQKLIRLKKNDTGCSFEKMKYEEIQNDYHAYWYIVKDKDQPPALIANCMRNIIEYFFNFVEKINLNNYFQQNEFINNIKYQGFYRYVNRESHSLGQNIFDIKEFNYEDFKEAFAQLFKISGYEDHYNKMMNE
ncbi:Wobble nucleotide-excising tRNase [Apibacter mensalis]|uniref:Wobble nucleotide-excising tRNase n=1 Tax=Apibacter mensalis TaxID=1586267 RepID=A0A0X3AQR6_9FLAO|nr:AAA family ATPase [Apibacter mensalis]CVK16731.1 Wobble nucleotide-excising tRNase [Apibacter mensalis]